MYNVQLLKDGQSLQSIKQEHEEVVVSLTVVVQFFEAYLCILVTELKKDVDGLWFQPISVESGKVIGESIIGKV